MSGEHAPGGEVPPDGAGDGGAEELLEAVRAAGDLPAHVAVIMDGNGRWARARGLPRWEGHRQGMRAVRETVEASLEVGLEHLTLYAFSIQNWDRPAGEVTALMELLREYVESEKDELAGEDVRVRAFGDLDRLPEESRQAVDELQAATREGERMQLNLAISYGSRSEIVHAARRLARLVDLGAVRPEEIDEERFAGELYTADWPDPDLLVRTSGELRLSNFLLWQVAYSELYVTDVLWPDFDRGELFRALREYQRRDRRFGKVAG